MSKAPATSTQDKTGGRVVAWLLLGLLVLFGGLYVAAYYGASDNVPRGTEVSGVAIGGHPHAEAAERLQAGLADRVGRPIRITVDGTENTVTAEDLGFSVDYDASVAEAGGARSWHPQRLWNYYTGGDELEAVVEVDQTAFDATLARLDGAHGVAPVDGAVTFADGAVDTTAPVDGKGLEPTATREALTAALLAPDDEVVDLSTQTLQPDIDETDVQAALDSFANAAVRGPVELEFEGSTIKLFPRDYTAALSMTPSDSTLVPALDPALLHEAVGSKISVDGEPVDATVRLVNGRPKVIKARPGVTYDSAQLEGAFLDLVAAPDGERTLALTAQVAQPEFTTKDARALGIKEKVSDFTTYFPYAEYRNINIGRAAELVDGTILKPGETFSLNETVGERTRENGFTEGFMISNGIFKEDLGGGVSQMATTLFNGMFFAGLEDVEHKPHSFYISRYPVGREATVAWGSVDLRFKNDTDHGVLIHSWVNPSTPSSQGSANVQFFSTKTWDITTSTGKRYAFTQPQTRTLTTEDCVANQGYGGFDIDVKRYFRTPGSSELVRTENFHTTYTPSDTVICKPPPKSE